MPTTSDRWQAIARLRTTVRDECRQELTSRQGAESAAREELTRIAADLAQWQADARAALEGSVDLRRLQHARRGIAALNLQYQDVQSQCIAAAREVESARQALVAADRELKVVERLTEHEQESDRELAERRERARLDEMGHGSAA